MNCAEVAKLLNAHSDRELELAASLAVEEHLEGCAGCRRSFSNLQAVRGAIARLAATPPAPAELRLQVERDARAAAGVKRGAWLRSPLAVAAPGIVALALAGWLFIAGSAHRSATHPRIVYHISESANATAALRNLSNHLQAAPDATVVVVAHNNGVDFLLAGARDEAGRPFEPAIREYRRRGVEFRVCLNTLERRGIAASNVISEVNIVPSGIAEIGRLQIQDGFAYMRL